MANPTDRGTGKGRRAPAASARGTVPPASAVRPMPPGASMSGAESVVGSLASLPPLVGTNATSLPPIPPITRLPAGGDPMQEFFLDGGRDGGVNETEQSVAQVPEADSDRERILTFGLGNEEYGLEIMAVREILKSPRLTQVPRAPPMVLGVFSLRGVVIPVLSLTDLLGVVGEPSGGGRDARVLVVGHGDETVGLWVHRVASVVWMPKRAVEPAPAGLSTTRRALLRGLGRLDQRLIIVLDATQLAAQLGISLPTTPVPEVA